ncbi:MAG: hypothetical protein DRJ51_05980 [Thermoprotei archaeon]|nr:MAG: hypothetical protein DRJ51_05980 [Thermoprotei archaeon]
MGSEWKPYLQYYREFKQLDSLDFKIIRAMHEHGPFNVRRIAEIIGARQQTVNYRVLKYDRQGLVLFRAVIDEAKLGLKSHTVLAEVPLGNEELALKALTCYPVWRYAAQVNGYIHGLYVRYAIPRNTTQDLEIFLEKLVERGIILRYHIYHTSSPHIPLFNLDFYTGGIRRFDWSAWVDQLLEARVEELKLEPEKVEPVTFDVYDLFILRCLERNARVKFTEISREMVKLFGGSLNKYRVLVSRRMKERIPSIIRGYEVYISPVLPELALFLILLIEFTEEEPLAKYVTGLSKIPFYSAVYKAIGENKIFHHIVLPAYEYSGFINALETLAKKGALKSLKILISDLQGKKTWRNTALYQAYDKDWKFSYGILINALEKLL